jgi:opacity protein-like surface antigen
MKRFIIAAAVIMLMAGATAPASADITGWVGRASSDDLLIDGTTTWGGAIGFSIFRYFGAEFVVDYAPDSELPFDLEEFEDLFGVDVTMDMLFLSGNVILQYPAGGFTPYFTVGYGGFGVRISSDLLEDVEEALSGTTLYTYGFGAKVDVAPFIGIRGEWRTYRLNLDEEEFNNVLLQTENPTFSRLAVGVALTF